MAGCGALRPGRRARSGPPGRAAWGRTPPGPGEPAAAAAAGPLGDALPAARLAPAAGTAAAAPPAVPLAGVTGRSPVTIACWTRNVSTAGVTFGPGACGSPPAKKAAAPSPATVDARMPAASIRAAGEVPRGRHGGGGGPGRAAGGRGQGIKPPGSAA